MDRITDPKTAKGKDAPKRTGLIPLSERRRLVWPKKDFEQPETVFKDWASI